MSENTKQCPYCGEEILAEAKKCKHCKEWLVNNKTITDTKSVIENYISKTPLKTNCILTGTNLSDKIITESGMSFQQDEIPLLLLYKKNLFFDLKTRILITDKHIYYKVLPDTFWVGLFCNFMKKKEGSCELQGLDYLEIAEHDHAFGTAYIGHQLKINNDVMGLVRMGTGIEYDDNAIQYLNNLFNTLADNSIIRNRVRAYSWQ